MTGSEPAPEVIVVGAGSAGSALAARLVRSGRRVLLLEAGRDYPASELAGSWRSPNPVAALVDPGGEELLWEDHLASRTAVQEPSLYWRGKGLGGSSVVNGQIAIRPPVEDFDDWAADGCTGWSADEVLPYLAALESDQEYGDQPAHGAHGPIPVHRYPEEAWGAVDRALRDAALAAGRPWAPDVNAPGATGVSPYPVNSVDGLRVSCHDAYLEPLRGHDLLTIRGEALVDRVELERGRAVGVRLADGEVLRADSVVLCAGATATPSILIRSGIGPAPHLSELGITVQADLPVGEGLQDHPMALIGIPLTLAATAGPRDRHTNCCIRYSSGMTPDTHDMMMVALNQNALAMASAEPRAGAGAVGVFVNRTYSRGTLRLRGTDPRSQPALSFNMLDDDRDVDRLAVGLRQLAELVENPAFGEITAGDLWAANAPVRAALDGPEAGLRAYLRATAVDTQHATSTCRMGDPAAATTVVDPDGRVLGIEGLRVADASVFPFVPRANTHLASVLVGELLAARLA
ncbi:NAD(P)-binding protein [Pimelobacter simplex]|uniref:Choline dehydrogenase n=1 Tax=Nocardioides simplex TaxID=2045 RepID=A0A0A1DHS8_NOCSI|nr:GMC family oxidoreductase [Pimelobacter simplex]AIY16926.1 Choline dehydrogenase [Pimelobacter simplex]MCG8152066.1 NAD(P)-binding protein [Pimelobacter simplex]GEB12819.1 GMC family oxidoreductase [Pimelobacter simplex]SFM53780.1 choline dehydrogenase [Pimelobacter simplex]